MIMANKSFTSELECSICFEIPVVETKVYQCSSGHILCQTCHCKMIVCPTCQKNLRFSHDGNHLKVPIRCLAVENMIRQLPSVQLEELGTLQSEMAQMMEAFQSFEFQVKEFNTKMTLINHKLKQRNIGDNICPGNTGKTNIN